METFEGRVLKMWSRWSLEIVRGERAGGVARAICRQEVEEAGVREAGEHAHVNCHFSPNKKYVEIIGWTFVKADEKLNYRLNDFPKSYI